MFCRNRLHRILFGSHVHRGGLGIRCSLFFTCPAVGGNVLASGFTDHRQCGGTLHIGRNHVSARRRLSTSRIVRGHDICRDIGFGGNAGLCVLHPGQLLRGLRLVQLRDLRLGCRRLALARQSGRLHLLAHLGLEARQLVVLELNQALHVLNLFFEHRQPRGHLLALTTLRLERLVGDHEVVLHGLEVSATGGSGCVGTRLGKLRSDQLQTGCSRGLRRRAFAGYRRRVGRCDRRLLVAPFRVLSACLAQGLRLAEAGQLLARRHAEHVACFQVIDIIIIKCLWISVQQPQHGLFHADIAIRAQLLRNLPQGVITLGKILARKLGDGWHLGGMRDPTRLSDGSTGSRCTGGGRPSGRCGSGHGKRGVHQHRVLAQQATLAPGQLQQKIQERFPDYIAAADLDHRLAVGVGRYVKAQLIEKQGAFNAGTGEGLRGGNLDLQFLKLFGGRGQQFDFRVKRLIQGRFEFDFSESQSDYVCRGKCTQHRHCQGRFPEHKAPLFSLVRTHAVIRPVAPTGVSSSPEALIPIPRGSPLEVVFYQYFSDLNTVQGRPFAHIIGDHP